MTKDVRPRKEPVQRPLDELLRGRIDAGRRFIENEHGRVLEQRPRDGDALLFSHGELYAALADMRVVAFRQDRDELVHASRARHLLDFRPGRTGPAEAEIVKNGTVEEKRLLRNDADLLAQFAEGNIGHVAAIEQDFSAGRLVKPAEQRNQRRLSRTRGTDQRDALAGLHAETDFMQRRHVGAIGKRNVAILDLAAGGAAPPQGLHRLPYHRNSPSSHREFRRHARWRRGPPGRAG